MKYLLHYIQETFVIEGDVVCAQNIFFHQIQVGIML